MQKISIRLIIFFFAFSIGLSVYFIWHFPASFPVSEIPFSPNNVSDEAAPSKVDDKLSKNDFYNLAPCIDVNSFKKYEFSRKAPTISRGVLNGLVLCGILPEYPQTAKGKNVYGVIKVNVLIDETGEVKKAQATNGNPLLRQQAERAVYQTRFYPTLLGGESMKVNGVLIYQFDSERGFWLKQ